MTDMNERAANADAAETDGLDDMYLLFNVDGQVYGIEIRYVLQIIGMQTINEMPEMPPGMKGYVNLRGSVIPVASMRSYFGRAETEYTDRTCIIVVMIGQKEIGMIVDAIQETLTIDAERVAPTPSTGALPAGSCVKGVARLANDDTAMLFHVPTLFAS